MDNHEKEIETFARDCLIEAKECLYNNKIKEAENLALRAKDAIQDCDAPIIQIDAYNLLGVIYDIGSRIDKSVAYLLDALYVAEENNVFLHAAVICNNLGACYNKYNEYEKAERMFDKAACYSEKCTKEELGSFVDIVNMNLGAIKYKLGDYKAALEYAMQLDIKNESDDDKTATSGQESIRFSKLSFKCLVMWRNGYRDYIYENIENLVQMAIEGEGLDYLENISYVIELLMLMNDTVRLKAVIESMDRYCDDDNTFLKIEIAEKWLKYYEMISDDEGYYDACEKYVELSRKQREKEKKNCAHIMDTMFELKETEKEKNKVQRLSDTDSLTLTGSRNKMMTDSEIIIRNSINNNANIGIGIIDIDYFKECNDAYGHIKGDLCLKEVARVIKEVIKGKGFAYRFGGDEFLLVIPEGTIEVLHEIATGIKEGIKQAAIPNEKSPISAYITLSQGYIRVIAKENDNIYTLVELVDDVLYDVKNEGRDGFKCVDMVDSI